MTHIPGKQMPLLEIDVLRTFLIIAECGSFSKAADIVGRTPSAVSMQIRKLELMLGITVFSRESRTIQVTDEGESLLGYARRMLMLNDEAVSLFCTPSLQGEVRFGAPSDFGTRFLPELLSRFAQTHPGVNVSVHLDGSPSLNEKVTKGELDLIMYTVGADSEMARGGKVIYTENLAWAGLKGGVAWSRDPLPLALSVAGCPWRRAARTALDKMGRQYRIAYQSFHSAGQEAAILADLAIAPFPEKLIKAPLKILGNGQNLPSIGEYQIVMKECDSAGKPTDAFAGQVESFFKNLE